MAEGTVTLGKQAESTSYVVSYPLGESSINTYFLSQDHENPKQTIERARVFGRKLSQNLNLTFIDLETMAIEGNNA
jgi:hypothetical protein